ncbi:MAG TPA: glycine C-acetyltransferase [Vicinamibacteria bacterium]|jgi:glycine C-acetyltransferase|nr:glycine C-acetyltransferase [Vicinamibacteria bacterium]
MYTGGAMDAAFRDFLSAELQQIRDQGLWKEEWPIRGPQGPEIRVQGREGTVLNFCANNYLGLSSHPELLKAAHRALDEWGYGMSSVRFICGTQELHLELERKVADFLGMEDAILYAACFDANGGVFEPLLGAEDAILTDQLNHASIIDGVRLCKAKRFVYQHADMGDLEAKLKEAAPARLRLIVTDGVFSMDGDVAPLPRICDLAESHRAMVLVDDSHATGFLGKTGRGSGEHCGVLGRIDILTTTFGKALGGASGGCVAARRDIIALLRQRSRPYLFSNTLPPVVVGATLRALEILGASTELRDRLEANTRTFRERMSSAGFEIKPGAHPIVPILFSRFTPDDAALAQRFARALLQEGIYVKGFFFPVVPRGQSRIRVQLSAAHRREHIDRAVEAFTKVGRALGVLGA